MSGPVDWIDVSIDVGWGMLHGKRCIVGGIDTAPTLQILGIHGWLDNANTFDRLVPLLPSGIEVFVLDLPGHGRSGHLPDGAHYNTMTYVANVRSVVLKLGWKSFVVLSHSMGSMIAAYYIALFPVNVTAFILLDYMKPYVAQDRIAIWRAQINLLFQTEQNKKSFPVYSEEDSINRLINSRMTGPNRDVLNINRDGAKILLSRSTKRVDGGLTWSHDHKVRVNFPLLYGDDNWLYVITQIKCPVLLVHATRGFSTLPDSVYKIILDTYQKNAQVFKYSLVEGTHYVHLTHPLRVAPSVIKFLSKIMVTQKLTPSKL